MTDQLPPISSAALPARLRDASPARQQDYRAALAMERTFALQLAETMLKTTREDDEGAPAAVSIMRQQLPGTLADAMVEAGGFGLADQMDRALHPEALHTALGGSGSTAVDPAETAAPTPASAAGAEGRV